jgi:transcriptional regulator with XRE-family HTH domain
LTLATPQRVWRVAHLRRRRGISQLTLAGRMGRSESRISKVERGERRIDRVSVIEQLATVLDVDPGILLGWGEGSHGEEPGEVGTIRAALMRYDAIGPLAAVGVPGTVATPGAPAALPDLRREVERVWADFQASRHRAAGSALPGLLQRADAAARAFDGDGRLEALGLLAFAYQATAATLLKAGATELAWVAADRGVSAAERSGNRLSLAGCSRMVGGPRLPGRRSLPPRWNWPPRRPAPCSRSSTARGGPPPACGPDPGRRAAAPAAARRRRGAARACRTAGRARLSEMALRR